MKARIILTAILFLATSIVARAEASWTVTNDYGNSNTFTIKRSDKTYTQKVLYRTISLSAYAGQHFTAQYGTLEFPAGIDTKTITVTELSPTGAYQYHWEGTTIKYGFEVTDRAGYRLAYAERSKTWGTSVSNSGIFSEKTVTIRADEVTVTDKGYAQTTNPHTAASTSFYTAGTQAYLGFLGSELRMTLDFQAKEVNDGYQYVQILTDNTTDCDTGAGSGNPGTLNISRYMAGFDISGKGVDTYYNYSFPVTSVGNDAGATTPWTGISNTVADLVKQKFNTGCRATNGKLILPTNFNTLVVRLNASGDDSDNWKARNINAKIEATDAVAPTKLAASVNPGRHATGNTFYVSVAFSEIVRSSNATLVTSWDDAMTLEAGSGTNVLTFKGTIKANSGNLNITGKGGDINDIYGYAISGSIAQTNLATLDGDLAYSIDDFQKEGGNYLITCRDDLSGLAGYVNGGNNCSGLTFLQVTNIAFPHNDAWNKANSTENNFTAIGGSGSSHRFGGIYDGGGYTISGIRIYMDGTSDSNKYQGLFGYVREGTIRNVHLTDTRITGHDYTGGIVGYSYQSTVEKCVVGTNVCLNAAQSDVKYHGGIAGYFNKGTLIDCLSIGTVVNCASDYSGAVYGYVDGSPINSRYYYLGCTVAGSARNNIATIPLPEHVSYVRELSATLPGTNNKTYTNGADINGVFYGYRGSTQRLSYDSSFLPSGYAVSVSVKETSTGDIMPVTDNGDYTFDFIMPTTDVTVTVNYLPIVSYIDADGIEQSHACTPIVSGTGDISLGVSGKTNWYCIGGDVTIDGKIYFADSHSHVIVMDGAHLTVNGAEGNHAFRNLSGSITIYGQSKGSGTITISGYTGHNAISVCDELTINGGIVNCTGSFAISTFSSIGKVTINRGSVTANGTYDGIRAKTITLGCATMEDRITASSYDGTVIIADGQTLTDGSAFYTGTLDNDQKAYIAGKTLKRYLGAISYIDENGQEQTCSNYTILSDEAISINDNKGLIGVNKQDTWYVAFGNYTFSDHWALEFKGHIHLILCDGATFTVSCSTYGISASTLSIYGQSEGTGSLVASSTIANNAQGAIAFYDALTINGGNVSTSSVSGNGITNSSGSGTLTINGGNVHASGANSGISCGGNIILGWTRATDRIYVSSYSGNATISVKDGHAFSNGTEILSGTITDRSKLDDKTLVPATNAIAYIDADGSTKYCTEYTVIESSNSQVNIGSSQNAEKWYVVSGNVTIDGGLMIRDQLAHLILCDGATLTVNCSSYNAVNCSHALTIYGQSGGTGTLRANTTRDSSDGLRADGNITINGGNVRASSNNSRGIYAQDGDIIINGGNINVTGESNSTGMQALRMNTGGSIIINGGTVNAIDNKYGMISSNSITLGWTKLTDQITAKNYSGSVKIATDQALTDGTNTYGAGTLSNDQRVAIAGKTLRPAPVGGDASASLTAHMANLEAEPYFWASFYHSSWNYRLPVGAQAFIMKSDKVLYRIGDGSIIPAGCAVVIMADESALTDVSGESGTLTLTATLDAPVGVSDGLLEANILRGLSSPTPKNNLVSGLKQVYVLNSYSYVLSFRPFNGSSVPAGKAFYVK